MLSHPLIELFLAHPVVHEIVSEAIRAGQVKTILRVLEARFGSVSPTVAAGLRQVMQEHQLNRLIHPAARPVLFTVAVFYIFDSVLSLFLAVPLVDRLAFLVSRHADSLLR